MGSVWLSKLPFALHAIIETGAALSFMFLPEKQLPGCSPATKLVLRQYGGLLLSTNFICVLVLAMPDLDDATARLLAACLGSYHFWPSWRAVARLSGDVPGDAKDSHSLLGGPLVHLGVHVLCAASFFYAAIF
ncbi:hypothetical protein BX600DRAFT_517547 [Xylariales sp. PMI_506]|nr:hypothetical protein BX600DRAFT_517547 [Xylariales sp. PMI_506]